MRSAICAIIAIAGCTQIAITQQTVYALRLTVTDTTGAPLAASGDLISHANQIQYSWRTDASGVFLFENLPFGGYKIIARSPGFASSESALTLPSQAPIAEEHIVLVVAGGATSITVTDTSLLDAEPGYAEHIGHDSIEQRPVAQPARELVDLVRAQPGWLIEANGVLHPRGAEYDVQYVMDGVPLLDNRSPAFAPALDISDVQAISVRTGGYPAYLGRKLGGVVEVTTRREFLPGWHGAVEAETGSFDAQRIAADIGFARAATSVRFSASGARTQRFLDPPTLENFFNDGHTESASGALIHRFDEHRRLRADLRSAAARFDVPNELRQQLAGQRQKRYLRETAGQAWYQQVISANALLELRAMGRDLSAALNSNASSTPIIAGQERNIREFYGGANFSVHHGRQDIQTGVDYRHASLRERFNYSITDPAFFAPGVLPKFQFAQRSPGNEAAWFVQDRIAFGALTVNAGIRLDYYNLLLQQTAWSPRLAAAYSFKPLAIALRASYDRIFNTPATENLLLASSPETRKVSLASVGLPLLPARGNFYEVGASKLLGDRARLDVAAYRRGFVNAGDDDVFLNTGISFPIAFSSAQIEGIEASLQAPLWRRFSFNFNYSNLSGSARLPVTGGLLLEGAPDLPNGGKSFRITQDQRNTFTGKLGYQASKRLWFAASGWYGSGLPVEVDAGAPQTEDLRILRQVNFERGKLRPSAAVNLEAGAALWKRDASAVDAQLTVANIANRINVINFAGLFSGTALSTPRSLGIRLRYSF